MKKIKYALLIILTISFQSKSYDYLGIEEEVDLSLLLQPILGDIKETSSSFNSMDLSVWIEQPEIQSYYKSKAEKLCISFYDKYGWVSSDKELTKMEEMISMLIDVDCRDYVDQRDYLKLISDIEQLPGVERFFERNNLDKQEICNRKRVYVMNSEEYAFTGGGTVSRLGYLGNYAGYPYKRACSSQDYLDIGWESYIDRIVFVASISSNCVSLPLSKDSLYSQRIESSEEPTGIEYGESLIISLDTFEQFCKDHKD